MISLNKQIANGAVWTMGLRISVRAIGFISTIVLARLLTPEDFGLVAIIMSFFALIDVIGDFGFDTVLIQRQNATVDDYNTAWTFNFVFGFILCSIVACLSGGVADFYENHKLQPIMLILSLLFLFNGIQNIGVVDFRKNFSFDKEFKLQIIPKLISFFCTISLAFWFRNYWALVIGALIWKACIALNSFLLSNFRPKFTFSSWKDLFSFSKWLMINNFFYFANNRSPEMIIGKILSPQAAGFFAMAQEISTLPTSEIAATINRAAYPGYSKISHQPEILKNMYINVTSSISLIVVPAGVGIASIAGILVPVVLGEQWLESIVLVRYTAIGGALLALNSNIGYIFLAMGKPKITALMNFFRVIIFIPVLICLSFFYGLEGAALAVLLTSMATFFIYNFFVAFKLKISWWRILSPVVRPVFASVIMWISVIIFEPIFYNLYGNKNILILISAVVLGALVYGVCILFLWILLGRPNGPETKLLEYLKNTIINDH